MDCVTGRGRVDRAVFPPEQVAEVVAVACELPPGTSGRWGASRALSCTGW
jgi:hypothetical protein